jgi:hypothetical protein
MRFAFPPYDPDARSKETIGNAAAATRPQPRLVGVYFTRAKERLILSEAETF